MKKERKMLATEKIGNNKTRKFGSGSVKKIHKTTTNIVSWTAAT